MTQLRILRGSIRYVLELYGYGDGSGYGFSGSGYGYGSGYGDGYGLGSGYGSAKSDNGLVPLSDSDREGD